MSIHFICPRCRSALTAPGDKAGTKVHCPSCQQRLQIPQPALNKTILAPFVESTTPLLSHAASVIVQNQPAKMLEPAHLHRSPLWSRGVVLISIAVGVVLSVSLIAGLNFAFRTNPGAVTAANVKKGTQPIPSNQIDHMVNRHEEKEVTTPTLAEDARAKHDGKDKSLARGIPDLIELLEEKLIEEKNVRATMNVVHMELWATEKTPKRFIIPAGTIFRSANPIYQDLVVVDTQAISIAGLNPVNVEIATCCTDAGKAAPMGDLKYRLERLAGGNPIRILAEDLSLANQPIDVKQAKVWQLTGAMTTAKARGEEVALTAKNAQAKAKARASFMAAVAPTTIDLDNVPKGGRRIESDLSVGDAFDYVRPGCHAKVFQINVKEGRSYTIDMVSTQIDSYLRLEDAAGNPLAEDDDSGGNLNARITFRPAENSIYRIIATSFVPSTTGPFTLTVLEDSRLLP